MVNKLSIPACIPSDCHKNCTGSVLMIETDLKHALVKIDEGLTIMTAPSCQVLPATSRKNFKACVDATHEYCKFPLTHSSQSLF